MTHHFLSLLDWSTKDLTSLLDLAARLKSGTDRPSVDGRILGMIFQKSSTRTRVSFEAGMLQLGGGAIVLPAKDLQLGRGETVADTARVLSRYVDGIMARTYAHQDVVDLAKYGSVPVINGLTDRLHPCQALADYFTIREAGFDLARVKIAYVGDGNNMAHSLIFGAARFGSEIRIATPAGYEPLSEIVATARAEGEATGARIEVGADPAAAVDGVDIIYTDVWASMGQEEEHQERCRIFREFQVNEALVSKAAPKAKVMHCLPAHRGEEITDDVVDGSHSIVWDQAENRLHVQKAILLRLWAIA